MKLLFLDFTLPHLLKDAEFPAGGWAVQLRQLLIGLTQAGHRAGVLTWKGANAYVGPQSLCDLLETYDPERGIRKLRFFNYFLPSLYSAARSYRPDVMIQSCSGVETATAALLAKAIGVPFVHRIASNPDTDGQYVQYLALRSRIAYRYGLKNARFVICQNAYQLHHIKQQFPRKPAGILHNCILIPRSSSAVQPRAQRTYIAWVGNFSPPKNLPLLLDIARQCPEIEFRIAGALPSRVAEPAILAALQVLKTLNNIVFVGYLKRSAMLDFLGGAIALLCTSDFEGFSNTFLESFAAGTPVILREAVDPDAIVARNDLGIVARDQRELGPSVRKLASLPAVEYVSLARRCRDYVERYHSTEEAVRKLISFVEPLATRSHTMHSGHRNNADSKPPNLS